VNGVKQQKLKNIAIATKVEKNLKQQTSGTINNNLPNVLELSSQEKNIFIFDFTQNLQRNNIFCFI
jgi:hypothetical protein